MCYLVPSPPLSTIDRSKRLQCRVPKGLTRRGAFHLFLVFFLRLLLLLRIPPPNSSSSLTLPSSFPGCGGSRVRLRGRSSCSVGGGGLMDCAVSIGCVAALRPPQNLGPSRPKVPTQNSAELGISELNSAELEICLHIATPNKDMPRQYGVFWPYGANFG